MSSPAKKAMYYLKTRIFKPHKNGNYGMYGLNFLGTRPLIQMQGDIWHFLWWETGTNNATFINSNGVKRNINIYSEYYSNNRDNIIRMEEYNIDNNLDINNIIIDYKE
jgi:hypothetical protein